MIIQNNTKIYIIALAAHGEGISGSDRIFIEFSKNWSRKISTTIITWEEGVRMIKRGGLKETKNLQIIKLEISNWAKNFFIISYLSRIIVGIWWALNQKMSNKIIVYSASEFWMDSLPALILKLMNSKSIWSASWYQTAPNPLKGFSESTRDRKYRFSAFLYYFTQLPIKPLILKFADYVLVNNPDEQKKFPRQFEKNRTITVLGAVDLNLVNKYRAKFRNVPKIYDALFQGRFHPQKGVVELVEIWRMVVSKYPKSKLVMIGDGPLMNDVKKEIIKNGLEKNIVITGYLFDGEKKFRTFSQSKLVVHPSFYDSGGMASAEAMAFGIPAVGFDLRAYKDYYPVGMLKAKNSLKDFAEKVISLLKNNKLRVKQGQLARVWINDHLSWKLRADQVLERIISK